VPVLRHSGPTPITGPAPARDVAGLERLTTTFRKERRRGFATRMDLTLDSEPAC